MQPPRIAPLALAALCACAAAARADSGHQQFQVRLQVLSTCRVATAPDPDTAALAIRCSRRTPFALGWGATTGPQFAGTGAGMTRVGATWPLRDNPGQNTASALDSSFSATTLHIDY